MMLFVSQDKRENKGVEDQGGNDGFGLRTRWPLESPPDNEY